MVKVGWVRWLFEMVIFVGFGVFWVFVIENMGDEIFEEKVLIVFCFFF